MWLALIVSSALHGLVLLPVLLSLFGGRVGASLVSLSLCHRTLARRSHGSR